jgi:hypothetical protein
MRKLVIYTFAASIIAIVSVTVIDAGLTKSSTVAATSGIDTLAITLAAGTLPVVQVDEPF